MNKTNKEKIDKYMSCVLMNETAKRCRRDLVKITKEVNLYQNKKIYSKRLEKEKIREIILKLK